MIEPSELRVPSTLYTGIGWDNFFRLNHWLLAYSRSMHTPVQPESKRAMTDFFSTVLVVSISTFKLSEVETSPIAAIVRVQGKVFSHFGIQILRVFEINMGMVVGLATDDRVLSISGNGISEVHIFDKTSKWL